METTAYFCHKQKRMKKIVVGIFLLTAGLLLLGFNTGHLDPTYRHIIFSWPVLLIAIGIINFCDRSSFWAGVILTSIGTFFLIPHLYVFNFNFIHLFWPVLLIIFGVVLILKRTFFHSFFVHKHNRHGQTTSKIEDGYIDHSNIFSGSHQIVQPCEFKGGKINNVFGGAKIDLTRTTLAAGDNVLEISCVFGGVELIVPSNWKIQTQVSSIMGAFNDKRYSANNQPADSDRKLIIKGSTVFGGGEVKSFI
jgi:predicted membrane protein